MRSDIGVLISCSLWEFHAWVRRKHILTKAEHESTELALMNLPFNQHLRERLFEHEPHLTEVRMEPHEPI